MARELGTMMQAGQRTFEGVFVAALALLCLGTVTSAANAEITLLEPVDDSTLNSTTVTFAWESTGISVFYRISVSPQESPWVHEYEFTYTDEVPLEPEGTRLESTQVLADGPWYWRVVGLDVAGDDQPTTLSAVWQFTIDTTIPDTTAPTPGIATPPDYANSSPIEVTYSGASDTGGSGLEHVELWYKKGAGGTWTNSGLTDTGASGSFDFAGMSGDDTYYFALVAEDNAGNRSPEPSGDGDDSTIYDTTPPGPGTAQVQNWYNESPIIVGYSGAGDPGGSGLKHVRLWYKEAGGTWDWSWLTRQGAQSFFAFDDAHGLGGDGTYYFDLVAEDNAGNRSPEPSGDGDDSTNYDTTPPVVTLNEEAQNPQWVLQHDPYTELGATATDLPWTSSLSVIIGGDFVNTEVVNYFPGYRVIYTATDAAGNSSARTRLVRVAWPDDPDYDGLSNEQEDDIGTNPNVADTDGDGFNDWLEYLWGSDPLDPGDVPAVPTMDYRGIVLLASVLVLLGAALVRRREARTAARASE